MIFGSFSVSGNQWYKLLYFYDEWRDWLNLLVSQADIYRTRPSFRSELTEHGIRGYLPWKAQRVHAGLASKPRPSYREYAKRGDKRFGAYRGLVMLDSGGFTFGNLRKLALLRSRTRSMNLVETATALEREQKLEASAAWSAKKARSLAGTAQVAHMKFGLSLRPDFLVSLDRIIESPSLPTRLKQRRAFFSISCAVEGLKFLSRLRESGSLFLPVVHPYGPYIPVPTDESTKREIVKRYEESATWQIQLLEEAEAKSGATFGGLAIGSLVPFENSTMVPLVGKALKSAIQASSFRDRFIHCFGANNDKLEILVKYGVHSFDTNHHMKLARNRLFYSPAEGAYVGLGDRRRPKCRCAICSSHPGWQFRESRKGLREVPTILIGLHNFQSNHLDRLRRLSAPFEESRETAECALH